MSYQAPDDRPAGMSYQARDDRPTDVSSFRLAPPTLWPAVFWGEAPVLFAALVTSGLLWGTGHDLPSTDVVTGGRADLRTVVAWLAAVALLLLFTYSMLGLTVRLIRGLWPRILISGIPFGRSLYRRALLERDARDAQVKEERYKGYYESIPDSVEKRPLRLTMLGNAEEAVVWRVARRYKLDLGLAWPRLAPLIPQPEREALADAERGVDAAISSAAGWLIATAWLVVASLLLIALGGTSDSRFYAPAIFTAIGAVGALALYVNSYRRAVDRTVSHGRAVESVVDLHRLSLLDALGWSRPASQEEEQLVFRALSDALSGEVGAGSQWYTSAGGDSAVLASLRSTLDATMDELPDRLRATVDNSVSRAVRDSVNRDLPQAVTESVLGSVEQGLSETLHRTLAGPRLDPFEGHLSVALLDEGTPVPVDDTGSACVTWEHLYQLSIIIGQQPHHDAVTAPVRIRGAKKERSTVSFAVSIDSNVPALRQSEKPLSVDRHGESELGFPLRINRGTAVPTWLWIRVTQHGRTIQNLQVTLIVPEADK